MISFGNQLGRPRGEHKPEAQQSWLPKLSHLLHESQPSHSSQKNIYKAQCLCPKHCVQVTVRSANYSDTALACRVCNQQGSEHERMLYKLLDEEKQVVRFAVESMILVGKDRVWLDDVTVISPHLKRWDVTILQPHGLLVEVQGEGHSSKPVQKRNNTDETISSRQLRDMGYAQAALREKWSVLWLWVEEGCTKPHIQASKWKAQFRQALAHVMAGGEPKLFGA